MDKICLIVTGGDFCVLPEEVPPAQLVIACDRGWLYAEQTGIRPDVIIGDFDSAAAPPESEIPVLRYPSQKDDTDTMLAVKYALEHGCSVLYILYALGGRLDHTFANIQSGAYASERGARVVLLGQDDILTVFANGKRVFPRRAGWSLSVFSLCDRCEGVTIQGAKYEAENVSLTGAFPLGASNGWRETDAEISVRAGTLLVIESRLKPGEHN